MRDDLHKGAPVSRTWRSLIRRCALDASWRLDGPLYAKKAIQELANRITPGVFGSLLKTLGSSQLSLDLAQDIGALRLKYSDPLEVNVIDQVRLTLHQGAISDPQRVVHEAMRSALHEEVEAQLRSTSLHVLQKSPGSEKELMRRMKWSLAESGIDQVVDNKVAGVQHEKVEFRRPVDFEEDISRG